MEDNTVAAEHRESFGKGAARKLRAAGRIPAVLYGRGTDPQHVSLPAHQVTLLVRTANAVFDLDIAGKRQLALVKDVQKDPVRQIIEHLDLVVVRRGEKVQVEVPIHLEGKPFASNLAEQEAHSVTIEVEALHIPEHVLVSVEGLDEGAQVLASAVTLPEGATLVSDPDVLVATVHPPQKAAESGDVAGAEG